MMRTRETLITKHLDLWTAALTTKATSGRGGSSKLELYGLKKLRELILELAVRGLLVAQDPQDEPASALLKRIAAEKAKLIKEGKIKPQKKLPPITEDEKPFELPEGWEWTRLGEVIEFINGYAFKSSEFSDEGVGVVKIGDIQNGVITVKSMSRVDSSVIKNLDTNSQINYGDLVIAMSGATTGKLGFNFTNEVFYLNQRVGKICPYLLDPKYLYFPLTTKITENLEKSLGSAIPNLSTTQIKDIILGVPPLAEQHRIVAKVDELMALCDRLEARQEASLSTHRTLVHTLLSVLTEAGEQGRFEDAWARIAEHFDILFTTEESIDLLKQSLLQLAVMGRLVPQNPADEPASALLEKIAAEKARLIKAGKLKKQEKLPPIREDEKPFDLPEGWEWCRWNDIAFKIGDIDHKMPEQIEDGIPYVSPRDFYPNNVINFDDAKKISQNDFERLAQKIRPEKGDIIFPRYGTIGANVLVKTDREFLASYSCCIIKTLQGYIDSDYQFVYSISDFVKSQCKKAENKTTQANVGIKSIQEFVMSMPPLNEQHRIVAKVDELMALCDRLKERIQSARAAQ